VQNEGGGGSVSLWLYGLASAVLKMFATIMSRPEDLGRGIQILNHRASIWAQFVSLKEKDGRIDAKAFDPYRDFFLLALSGSEVSRHRECEVCKSFFYAIRLNQSACSKRCNSVRRVRNWREKQATYEQSRKFKSAGVRPEGKKS
jgi:predicted nucleic acid-binding Zn ribbon protein